MSTFGVGGFGATPRYGGAENGGLDEATGQSIIKLARDILNTEFYYRPLQLVDIEDKVRQASHPSLELQSDLLNYLLTHPGQLNEPIAYYASAGGFAAQKGLGRLYRVLTRFQNFDYDKPDKQGNTQLHHAAAALSEEIVDCMIQMGHVHSKPNRAGESALDYVTRYAVRNNPAKRQAMMRKLADAGVVALNPSES
jgi:hypothetical protein